MRITKKIPEGIFFSYIDISFIAVVGRNYHLLPEFISMQRLAKLSFSAGVKAAE